jgi:4-hydroxymandelate oxidase
MSRLTFNRRRAIESLGAFLAASPLLSGQQSPGRRAPLIPPREELVNILEFAEAAEEKLPGHAYATIAGGDRSAFERMTFRPRMMVNTVNLDLTVDLFGEKIFAPVVAGPIAEQQQFHPDGELATVRGASAAKALMVVSSRSSVPLEQIVAQAKNSLWYQVFSERDTDRVRGQAERAVQAGCKAVCITLANPPGAPASVPTPLPDWRVAEQLQKTLHVPILLKGVMTPEDARTAVQRGIPGVIVSDYGGLLTTGLASPVEVLPSIVDAVGKNVPVLVDGGFRRGSDVVKALALGARAVLLGRPVMWGLAAYGAEGVQSVLEMMQTEVGRVMAGCGKVNLAALDRTLIKIHER